MRARILVGVVWFAVALAAPAAASAAITIGSDLSAPPSNSVCLSDCTLSIGALPGRQLLAPSSGVIVRWRLVEPDGTFRLRVLRPVPGGTYAFVGSTQSVSLSGSGVQTVPARLPILAGEGVAVDAPTPSHLAEALTPGVDENAWIPQVADGSTAAPTFTSHGIELLMNADIEPDLDGDGFGDETQDACPTDASRQGPCAADLALTAFSNSDSADAGRGFTLTLRVRNLGSSAAAGPRLSAALPAGTRVVAVRTSSGSCSKSPALACTLGDLGFGSDAALQLTLRTTHDGKLTLRPAVSSATADPSAGDNSAAVKLVVKAGKPRIARSGTVSRGVARVRLSCPRGGPGCYGTLSLGHGRAGYSIRAGRSRLVKVKLRGRAPGSVRAVAVSLGRTVRKSGRVTLR